MKKLIALLLAAILVFALVACNDSKTKDGDANTAETTTGTTDADEKAFKDSVTLKVANDEETDTYQAKIFYSSDAKVMLEEDGAGYCEITNEALDYTLTIAICRDGNYDENKEANKAEDKYAEAKYGDFDGYSFKSDSGIEYDVLIKLADDKNEYDVIYLSADLKSASHNLDVDIDALFALEEVQKTLNSFEYLGLVKNA